MNSANFPVSLGGGGEGSREEGKRLRQPPDQAQGRPARPPGSLLSRPWGPAGCCKRHVFAGLPGCPPLTGDVSV